MVLTTILVWQYQQLEYQRYEVQQNIAGMPILLLDKRTGQTWAYVDGVWVLREKMTQREADSYKIEKRKERAHRLEPRKETARQVESRKERARRMQELARRRALRQK